MSTLTGSETDDVLVADAAGSELVGAAGDDTLTGGEGSDLMRGGVGNDAYVFAPGGGADLIREDEGDGAGELLPLGDEFRVNTHVAGNQQLPTVTGLAGGGFVVAWESDGQDGSGYGVYAQVFDAAGAPAGDEFRVNSTVADFQFKAVVAALADGGFVVVWTSGTSSPQVVGQRYDADGHASGDEFLVSTTAVAAFYVQAHVAATSDGGFVVVWEGHPSASPTADAAYAQRYDAAGQAIGGNTNLSGTSAYDPWVTACSGGGFLLTYSSSDVMARFFDENGVALGSAFAVDTGADYGSYPKSIELANGDFVVIWQGPEENGSEGIFGQRISATGEKLGLEFHANTYTTDQQRGCAAYALADGGFLLSWYSVGQDGSGAGIYARRYDGEGVAQGDEFLVNASTAGNQYMAVVAGTGAGDDLVVAWFSDDQDGSGRGIYAQRLAPASTAGDDLLSFAAGIVPDDIALVREGDDLVAHVGFDGDQVRIENHFLGVSHAIERIGFSDGTIWSAELFPVGAPGDEWLEGTAGNDLLAGHDGNDTLLGGTGADTLEGGAGDDVYVTDVAQDVLTDVGGGIDTVVAAYSATLKAAFENLSLTGTAIQGAGNQLGNEIRGNDADNILLGYRGADTLVGGGGADTLKGGDGDDVYFVDAADLLVEVSGIDTVVAGVAWTLGKAYENLQLTGAGNINGTGNDRDNLLTGNDGNNRLKGNIGLDTLVGGAGNDTLAGGVGGDLLAGGSGVDRFLFDANLNGVADHLVDFVAGEDRLQLDDAVFATLTLGALAPGALRAGTTAVDADDRILYDAATGNLYYDADGNGSGTKTKFAVLDNHAVITASDFQVI